MTAVDVFSIAKDILVGLAASITAMAAIYGLRNWSIELRGKADFDVARNLMKTTYKVREELAASRGPMIVFSEFPENYTGTTASAEVEASAYNHVFKNRWEPVSKSLVELDSHLLEAEALWGSEVKQRVDALKKCAREVVIAMEMIVRDKAERGENFRANLDFAKEMNDKVFASRSDNGNLMNIRIRDAVNEIENIVRPHLQRN